MKKSEENLSLLVLPQNIQNNENNLIISVAKVHRWDQITCNKAVILVLVKRLDLPHEHSCVSFNAVALTIDTAVRSSLQKEWQWSTSKQMKQKRLQYNSVTISKNELLHFADVDAMHCHAICLCPCHTPGRWRNNIPQKVVWPTLGESKCQANQHEPTFKARICRTPSFIANRNSTIGIRL